MRAHRQRRRGEAPRFEHYLEGADAKSDMTGLGGGGKQLQNCKRAYLGAVQLLVELASLQTAFITLDVAIKTTNRRVNALENVVTPRLENTVQYIKAARRAGARGVLPPEESAGEEEEGHRGERVRRARGAHAHRRLRGRRKGGDGDRRGHAGDGVTVGDPATSSNPNETRICSSDDASDVTTRVGVCRV